jgi:hypothetical protein
MGDWLVERFTVFGVQAQNWMLIAFAIVGIGIALSWRTSR